jgi:hypothetical protein
MGTRTLVPLHGPFKVCVRKTIESVLEDKDSYEDCDVAKEFADEFVGRLKMREAVVFDGRGEVVYKVG